MLEWLLGIPALIQVAEQRLTRSLTQAECRQYLHRDDCPPHAPIRVPATFAPAADGPQGAFRVTTRRTDYPPEFRRAAEEQLGTYTLSLNGTVWRLHQVKPTGDTWETAGTYALAPDHRIELTDRYDPACYGLVMSATWSLRGTSLVLSDASATAVLPDCGTRPFNTTVAQGLLTSHAWSRVTV